MYSGIKRGENLGVDHTVRIVIIDCVPIYWPDLARDLVPVAKFSYLD